MQHVVETAAGAREEALTRAWRYEQFLALGVSEGDALALACENAVDLNVARELIRERGCPPALAAAILL